MANSDHLLEIARKGSEAWNQWRRNNPEEEIDFSGVDFTLDENQGVSFGGFEFGDGARFDGATFGWAADFEGATFGNLARLDGATFGVSAHFEGATFGYLARFEGATFGDRARFQGARFSDGARFSGATFGHHAYFIGATFLAAASFAGATFGHFAQFEGATFGYGANFAGATFEGATFEGATFGDRAEFDDATFGKFVTFKGVTFEGEVRFNETRQWSEPAGWTEPEQPSSQNVADEVTISSNLPEASTYFRSIHFSGARFLGRASFGGRDFRGEANFSNARFAEPPDFRATEHRENLDWSGVRFAFGWYLRLGHLTIPVRGWTSRNDTVTRLRRLRGIAKEIHALDADRDLFILERQAERGILWHDWWRGGWRTWLTGWWRPLTATLLMFLYRYSSNCGRSLLLPLGWLVASNWGFYHLYAFLIERPLFISIKRALFDLTFASAVPFGATARLAFKSAVNVLFQQGSAGQIDIPWQIQAASAAQGITNLVLVFLLGLALRNYFRFR